VMIGQVQKMGGCFQNLNDVAFQMIDVLGQVMPDQLSLTNTELEGNKDIFNESKGNPCLTETSCLLRSTPCFI
jgi:hypothetical protein